MSKVFRAAIAAAAVSAMAVTCPVCAATASSRDNSTARAEIQIGLCSKPDAIERALKLRPRGSPTEVWLFDDAALTLIGRGLRLRLRITDGRSELTLKVADQDCARLDPTLVAAANAKCEYDVHGAKMTGAVSLSRQLSDSTTKALLAGRAAPAQTLDVAQIAYLRDVVHAWPLPPGIRALGPTQVKSYRTKSKLYDVDVSQLPGGEQYVEISRKVPVADAVRVQDQLERDLARAGVTACADQSAQAINKLKLLLR